MNPVPPTELGAYLARPDSSYRVESREPNGHALVSQIWRETPWRHDLDVVRPEGDRHPDTALLLITGDRTDDRERRWAERIAERAGMTVAVLYQIPNQPLFELVEDDLIAHTFDEYLESGDSTWPLLFPMTKAVIRAMDAVTQITADDLVPIRRFVVTGASKRGWTAWLTAAAGDPRVIGVAPMVIDILNIPAQMRAQREMWGEYSPMIQPYTERGLQEKIDSERGKRLAAIVDPYSYAKTMRAPCLVVIGSNDPYWTLDAASRYWSHLPQPRSMLCVPNAGHEAGDSAAAEAALAAFARAVATGKRLPAVWIAQEATGYVGRANPEPKSARLWVAEGPGGRFAEAVWRSTPVAFDARGRSQILVEATTSHRGFFVEFVFDDHSLTSLPVIVPPSQP
jgi:PhoPQ-activated pathogenicity-related protein